jgi:RND superfamily putative drug exporter
VRLPWRTGEEGDPRFWRRWTECVMARPLLALSVGTLAMLGLAIPVPAIQTLNRGLEQLPRGSEVRAATERAVALAGPGLTGPVHVLVDDRAEADAARARVTGIPGVAAVGPTLASADGRHYLVEVTLDHDPESAPARATYHRIAAAAPGALLGGATAFGLDVEHAVFGGLWRMLLFILAASYVVLLVLLRSVLLPLKAVAMNLLSVGAAYGVLVAVFQWGWLDWTGYGSPGYVDTIVPALVLAVTFGLSMDYEVFLLTRIRERYIAHGRNELAVSEGLVASARIITSAALVMVAVFGAFALSGAPTLRELGVGLAVAVGLDATVVRLVIVPATMRLLGEWNWWLPRPLARVLPPAVAPTHGADGFSPAASG